MTELFDGQHKIILDSKYNTDLETLNESKLGIADIFFLAVIIGYRHQRSFPSINHQGKEFHPNYFSPLQRGLLYGLILNLPGVAIQDITDEQKIAQIYDRLIAFANGGLQWLRLQTFADSLDDQGAIIAAPATIIVRLNQLIAEELQKA